jgi:RNA polymerase-binding protein DksA
VLIVSPKKKTTKKATKKPGAKKPASKKGAAKKSAKSTAKKSTAKKSAVKKAKTTVTKKTTKKATKSPAKKATAKKATAVIKKPAAKSAAPAATKKTAKKKTKKAAPVVETVEPERKPTAKSRRHTDRRQIASIRETLVKKKDSLTRHLRSELSELEAPDKHHLADLEEMASDANDTDSLCEIMEVGANTLEQVDTALRKLDDGTYGVCEACDAEIPIARLEALPFASLCIPCKEKEEQGVLMRREMSS